MKRIARLRRSKPSDYSFLVASVEKLGEEHPAICDDADRAMQEGERILRERGTPVIIVISTTRIAEKGSINVGSYTFDEFERKAKKEFK